MNNKRHKSRALLREEMYPFQLVSENQSATAWPILKIALLFDTIRKTKGSIVIVISPLIALM